MAEANGTVVRGKGATERGLRAREIVRELGRDCNSMNVNDRLRAEGFGRIHDTTFYVIRKEIFPETGRRSHEEHIDRVVHGEPEPEAVAPLAERLAILEESEPTRLDYLSKFVKFACAVEAVGGVVAARRMLAAIEALPKVCDAPS